LYTITYINLFLLIKEKQQFKVSPKTAFTNKKIKKLAQSKIFRYIISDMKNIKPVKSTLALGIAIIIVLLIKQGGEAGF